MNPHLILDYIQLTYLGLKNRKLRSSLTMIGIFIGIAAVVSLISLGQGMSDAITAQFSTLGTDKLIITNKGSSYGPPGTGVQEKLTAHDEQIIERVRGVEITASRLLRSAKLTFEDENIYSFVVSMPKTNEPHAFVVQALDLQPLRGRMLTTQDRFSAVIGSNLYTGDFFTEKVNIRDKILIQDIDFQIVGVLEKKGNFQFDNAVLVPEETLRETLNDPTGIDIIIAKVSRGFDVTTVAASIRDALRQDRGLEEDKEDFEVQTPQQVLATVNSILFAVNAVLIGIAFISLIVGGIGIMNTIYTAVLERTKEIGIMKSIGARNRTVLLLFLIESGFLGLFGGAIGVFLGVIFSKGVEIIAVNIFGTALIQASLPASLLLGALLFSFLVGAFSGLVPAYQASRLNTVDSLRYE